MKHLAIQQIQAQQQAEAEKAARLASLEQAVVNSDAEKASLHSIISQKDQELQTLRAQIASMQSSHMQELNQAKNSNIHVESEMENMRSKLAEQEQINSEALAKSQSLEEELIAKDKIIAEQKEEVLALSSIAEQQRAIEPKIEELTKSIEELRADKQDLRHDKSLLQEQNKLLLEQIEQLKAEAEMNFSMSKFSINDEPKVEESANKDAPQNILDQLSLVESIIPSVNHSNAELSDILDGLTTKKTEYIERDLSGDTSSFSIIN